MKTYFQYLLRWFKRAAEEQGISIALVVIVLPALFIGISLFAFNRLGYAEYIYAGTAVFATYFLGGKKRNEFLKTLFPRKQYRQVRLYENLLVTIPFLGMLAYKMELVLIPAVLLGASALSFYNQVKSSNFRIPTPFGRNPFEFIIGFRRTFWVNILAIALMIIGIYVGNFPLALFALIVPFIQAQNFYLKMEPEFFVWMHNATPKAFILRKLKLSVWHALLLASPMIVSMVVCFPHYSHWIGLVVLVGILYALLGAMAKYAYFPHELNVSQQLIIALGIVFPPLCLILYPFFYTKSKEALKSFLK